VTTTERAGGPLLGGQAHIVLNSWWAGRFGLFQCRMDMSFPTPFYLKDALTPPRPGRRKAELTFDNLTAAHFPAFAWATAVEDDWDIFSRRPDERTGWLALPRGCRQAAVLFFFTPPVAPGY